MPENRLPVAALACCLLLATTACGAGGGSDDRPERTIEPTEVAEVHAEPALTVDCLHVIGERPAPIEAVTVFLGDVALETGRRLRSAEVDGSEAPHPLFAKSGLMVRAGAQVDIEVLPAPGNDVSIVWGSGRPAAGSVRVPGCPARAAENTWLAFAGGYHVDRPGCVTLVVRSRGLQTKVHVPVDADCRAQG